ncbi:MAG: hypothetical protein HC837_14775 [Chloroflexaceae bacterium]|nr:hypothetical protein [Chloroflexaceae bacterium]
MIPTGQLFDPHARRSLLEDVRRNGRIEVIGDDLFNVAVCGDELEQPHRKGDVLQPHNHALWQALQR